MTTQPNVPEDAVQAWSSAMLDFVKMFSGVASAADVLPSPQLDASAQYMRQQLTLWAATVTRSVGMDTPPAISPERHDRRFQADDWSNNAWYSFLKQNYLINARLLEQYVETISLDEKEKQKLRFYTRQFIDAASPSNYGVTNPEALRTALESHCESVWDGITNLQADFARKTISITDETAFEVGRNVAVSEGAVVFENDLFQLIQYAPLTAQVAKRPLLIVPPCINKFYILDLQPENSFVRFAVEQGQTVFIMSWRNPEADLAHTTWDDYLETGVMQAIDVVLAITGADKANTVGWCVGGTLLSSALAVTRARNEDKVASVTLLTTMLDFSDPGDLGVFIDEPTVAQREMAIGRGGIYSGRELGFTFQMLRANDLIWPYVVNNYLKGKSPSAFDLLYWNADSTNLPGPMYTWYLRNMYLENNLCVPGKLNMCDVPVDLGCVDMPAYVLATQDDHIVPWNSAWLSTQLLGGDVNFVLGASGHIAGVINPAAKNKRSYWADGDLGSDSDGWLASAQEMPGSWWTHWASWLANHAGGQVKARAKLGNRKHAPLEPAPGRYVKVRAD